MSGFNTLVQPRNEPEAGGAILSYVWSALAGLLVPLLVVLVGLIAVLLNSGGLSNEFVRLGTHLYIPLGARFADQAALMQLTELVGWSFCIAVIFSFAMWLHRWGADARARRITPGRASPSIGGRPPRFFSVAMMLYSPIASATKLATSLRCLGSTWL